MSENVSRVGACREPSPTREERPAPADSSSPSHDQASLDDASQIQLSDHSEDAYPAGEESTTNPPENPDEHGDPSTPSDEQESGWNSAAAEDPEARVEISPAPRPTPPPSGRQTLTRAQRRKVILEKATRGMQRDPWYLYRISARHFQGLVGMPRYRPGRTTEDIRRMCRHLRGCRLHPSAVILDHGHLHARHLRVAKRNPKPRPGSSPLRQAWIPGGIKQSRDYELFSPRSPREEDQRNIPSEKLEADPNLKAHFMKSVFPVLTFREEPRLPTYAGVSQEEFDAHTKAELEESSNVTGLDDMGPEERVETGLDSNFTTALLGPETKARVLEHDKDMRDHGDPAVGVDSPQPIKHDRSPDIAFSDPSTPSATIVSGTEIPDNPLASSVHVVNDPNELAAPGKVSLSPDDLSLSEVPHSEMSLGNYIQMGLKAPADAPRSPQEASIRDIASPHPSTMQASVTTRSLGPENDHLAELEPLDAGPECPSQDADPPSGSATLVENQEPALLAEHPTPSESMPVADDRAASQGTPALHSRQSADQLAGPEAKKSAGGLENQKSKRRRIARSSWAGTPLPSLMAPLKPIKRKAAGHQEEGTRKRLRNVGDFCAYNAPHSYPTIPSLLFCQLDGGVFDDMPSRLRQALPRPNDLAWPNNIPTRRNRFSSSEQPQRDPVGPPYIHAAGVTDIGDRYEDGEVRRYGAGESYRPFNNRDRDRSPRGTRSPPPRERARTPPGGSDSYVPGRSPRRRSRTPDRFRYRDRSREREGGDVWRRRDRSRSRARSPTRRSSPPRRSPPRRSPRRYPSPKRDDRAERARSPRRDYDARDTR